MALSLVGVLFVVLRGDVSVLRTLSFAAGDAWIAACCVAWIAYSLLLTRWQSKLGTRERLCCIIAGGLVAILPFAVWEVTTQPVAWASPALWGLVAAAGLGPGLIGYLAHAFVQRELGPSRTALMLYLAPVYGAMLAWWLLNEPPRWYHAVGAMLILPGIHLATRSAARVGR
jgi:drug/metabolite transporter (DMT)-like permease